MDINYALSLSTFEVTQEARKELDNFGYMKAIFFLQAEFRAVGCNQKKENGDIFYQLTNY